MNSTVQRRGMTIVELLVGLLATSVLALTACVMLFNVSKVCQRTQAGVDMQADGRVAMATIAQIIRSASYTNVVIYNLNDLRVTVAGATKRIYSNGLNLLYVDAGGYSLPLVAGRLSSFSVFRTNTTAIGVNLSMAAGDNTHSETLAGVFKCRN